MFEDEQDDPTYHWSINVPLVEGHVCTLECEIRVVDKENDIYGCLTGGTLHKCTGTNCERMIVAEDGQICLWSGRLLASNLDISSEFNFLRTETGRVTSGFDSSYAANVGDRVFRKNVGAKKKKTATAKKQLDPLKGVRAVKIRKVAKTPQPPERSPEQLQQLNKEKGIQKKRTEIATALEYLVWNDNFRSAMNKRKQDQFASELCSFLLKYVKNEKTLPHIDEVYQRYYQVKKNHEFLPLIGMKKEELDAVKERISNTIMEEYDRLVPATGKRTVRILHFALGYLTLMTEGIKWKDFELQQDPFLKKYHIDYKLLHEVDGEFMVESERKKKPHIPKITKDTLGNASKRIRQLLMDRYQ